MYVFFIQGCRICATTCCMAWKKACFYGGVGPRGRARLPCGTGPLNINSPRFEKHAQVTCICIYMLDLVCLIFPFPFMLFVVSLFLSFFFKTDFLIQHVLLTYNQCRAQYRQAGLCNIMLMLFHQFLFVVWCVAVE